MTRDLAHWQPRPTPDQRSLQGRFVRLEALDVARHGDDLWHALQGPDPALWDYLPYGPFTERGVFDVWLAGNAQSRDPLFYAVVDLASGLALGLFSYLRITAQDGSIEIGHVAFGAPMQCTAGATEAIYLLARHAFDDLGYRRLEWKCDAANARSRRAAERFGFTQEGLFRQHMVRKGRNRDTAWFSIIDGEWAVRRDAFERWLMVDNFDEQGQQRQRLETLRE
ncbi:GNAT family N-acetyltransferase [Pseudomonas sediminis]|uniref:GNAT family N-acetyltransferase n=1 Tax=Pseudomonas sediminis TaxID=1691904 RepID=UPI002449AA11|nr:GNAT family protein [Pseudomonas sediminis]MDG9759279.1 GNAT family N-acetyltransferase [Pseudomonas sediminis]